MEITHLPEDNLFKTVVDGYTAYVTYIIRQTGYPSYHRPPRNRRPGDRSSTSKSNL